MSAASKFIDAFRSACPARESKNRLTDAKLKLIEAECSLDYYSANVAMLKARIFRLESELNSPVTEVRPDRASIQAPFPGPGYTSTGESVKEPATRSKRLHATA